MPILAISKFKKGSINFEDAFLLSTPYPTISCGLYDRAVCITRNFSEPQNSHSFKSRAGYIMVRVRHLGRIEFLDIASQPTELP